jgi:hypothetical protein
MRDGKERDTFLGLSETLKRKAPGYLDILTAETDADFEKAFDTLLQKSVEGLETNKEYFKTLGEDALSGILALALTMPGLTVTREAHSNGHVDLTIVADHSIPPRKKLGEAKVWDGPEYHIKGLKQLLDRYTTGREGRGLVIAYVKNKNIAGLIEKLRTTMNKERPCKQVAETVDHVLKWSFLTRHFHSCGDTLEVGHIGCNLYTDTAN